MKCDNKLFQSSWAYIFCVTELIYIKILWDELERGSIRELMKQFVCLSAISLSILIWFNFVGFLSLIFLSFDCLLSCFMRIASFIRECSDRTCIELHSFLNKNHIHGHIDDLWVNWIAVHFACLICLWHVRKCVDIDVDNHNDINNIVDSQTAIIAQRCVLRS